MGEYRRDSRGGGRSSGGYNRDRGSSGGGFNRGRSSGGFGRDRDSRPREMHDVVCAKCGKDTQVPFKPTGEKPVLCRDCFEKEGGNSNRDSRDRGSRDRDSRPQSSGMTSDQFKQLNEKLDKILKVLENIEIEEVEEDEEESDDEEE